MAGEGSALISSVCSPSAGGTLPSCLGACDAGAVTPLNPLPAPQDVPPENVAPEDAPPQDAPPEDTVLQDHPRLGVDELVRQRPAIGGALQGGEAGAGGGHPGGPGPSAGPPRGGGTRAPPPPPGAPCDPASGVPVAAARYFTSSGVSDGS